jgi:hypothetical protein
MSGAMRRRRELAGTSSGVGVGEQDKKRAVDALRAAGGQFINFYAPSYVETFDDH